jgi:hypothetical protein
LSAIAPLAGRPLDLHEGIGDPLDLKRGCKRWPEHMRLHNMRTGEVVCGRCRATNLCPYCQTLYVVETIEMLTLDAMEYPPTLWVVLTAREHLTRSQCRDHLRQLRAAARRRWPAIEWFVQVEFQRRGALHLNLLVKGVPNGDLDALHRLLSDRWCARVDALPVGQWCGVVEDAGGTVRYLSKMLAHGLKVEQRPPLGWRGHRTSQTHGYLVRPASAMRVEARASLGAKRRLWHAYNACLEITGGVEPPSDMIEHVQEQLEARELGAKGYWEVVELFHVGADPSRLLRADARRPFQKLAPEPLRRSVEQLKPETVTGSPRGPQA